MRYLSKIYVDYRLVLITVTIAFIVFSNGTVMNLLMTLALYLGGSDNDYFLYYSNHINELLDERISYFRFIYVVIFCFPIIYFQIFARKTYITDRHLRMCVNISWFVMCWNVFFGQFGSPIFTRPLDYLMWFAIMGYSYMLKDMIRRSPNPIIIMMFFTFNFIAIYKSLKSTETYFGENKYITIFSDECLNQKYYVRDMVEFNSKRTR